MLSDDEDLDDLDEPMMEGSDDEFSDLEVDENEDTLTVRWTLLGLKV